MEGKDKQRDSNKRERESERAMADFEPMICFSCLVLFRPNPSILKNLQLPLLLMGLMHQLFEVTVVVKWDKKDITILVGTVMAFVVQRGVVNARPAFF